MSHLSFGPPSQGELGDIQVYHEHVTCHVPKFVRWALNAANLLTFSRSIAGTNVIEALEILRQRYNAQHYGLRKFYYECSNLKYLTGLINVPKLGQVGHAHSKSYFSPG
jgi:hypothetical protein